MRWLGKPGEKLVVNSSELRAVQGRQACDFKLTPPRPLPPLRQQLTRRNKKPANAQPASRDPKERLRLDRDLDREMRAVCEGVGDA